MDFKIIKQKEFSFKKKDGAEQKGVSYVVAHKARAIQVSTLDHDADAITAKDGMLTVRGEIELRQAPYTNNLGEQVNGLKLVPKMDLAIGV